LQARRKITGDESFGACLEPFARSVILGREPINLPGGRLARVRYAPIADVLLRSNETTLCAMKRLMQCNNPLDHSITSSASAIASAIRSGDLAVLRLQPGGRSESGRRPEGSAPYDDAALSPVAPRLSASSCKTRAPAPRVLKQEVVANDPLYRTLGSGSVPSAGHHSINSCARSKICGGTSTPIALAVLRLITKSNFVGCSTGMSAGLAPLRILPIKVAVWRCMST
jgi:hypothetical protein